MKKNTVTQEQINKIMSESSFIIKTILNKTTIVVCQLPNGFVITESSSCVDPTNYDEAIGAEICKKRIENKVWELEGYKLQCELNKKSSLSINVNVSDTDLFKDLLTVVEFAANGASQEETKIRLEKILTRGGYSAKNS